MSANRSFTRRQFIKGDPKAPKAPPTDLQRIAQLMLKELPPESGFVVITFPLDGSKPPRYVSNGSRESVLKLLKDFVEKQSKP